MRDVDVYCIDLSENVHLRNIRYFAGLLTADDYLWIYD